MSEKIQEEVFSSDEEFDDGDDSESDDSDVDARLAEDDVFDVQFLKCYSALKKKDNKIYDKNVKFFADNELSSSEDTNGDDQEPDQRSKTKGPKMTLLDIQLKAGQDSNEQEEELANPKIDLNQPVSKSYYEKELEEIKRSIEKVGDDIDEDDDDDDLFVVKGTEKEEKKRGPGSKIDQLLDKVVNEEDEDISHLKQVWSDPKSLTEEDKFLRDYILNKRYLPTTSDEDKDGFFSKNLDELSDAEEVDEEQPKKSMITRRSDEKEFDKIVRIPRNSTKTIRDMVEKQAKREKRAKKSSIEKKRRRAIAAADCEDVVGDLPTRFHYRETEPNDFGLTAEELLMADDEELDQWVNLKECVAYKSQEEELAQKQKFDSLRDDLELKKKIFKSLYGEGKLQVTETEAIPNVGKKRKRNIDSESQEVESNLTADQTVHLSEQQKKKKKHRRRGINHKKFAKVGVAPDRLLAYGLSKSKLKKTKLL